MIDETIQQGAKYHRGRQLIAMQVLTFVEDRSIHIQTIESVNRELREFLGNFTNDLSMDIDILNYVLHYNNMRDKRSAAGKIALFSTMGKAIES